MTRIGKQVIYAAFAAAALVTGADRALAMEPGNFGQTLSGITIAAPLAAPPPPGVYGLLDAFVGQDGRGFGQNAGQTVSAQYWAPTVFWSTGFNVLGANISLAATQPFYDLTEYPTSGATLGGNTNGPPFGGSIFFETISNSHFTGVAQWKLGGGWFAALGLTLDPPDGSRYKGTLNPDYFTTEPRVSIAYLSNDWHVTANFAYDFNSSSIGRTGTYQIVANAAPVVFNPALSGLIASIGNGYTSGQVAFLDVAALYAVGKWEFGPVASLEWQTTADTPGGGFSCAQVTALLGTTLSCGRVVNDSVGGELGYNFGLVNLQAFVTHSFFTQDAFGGWGVYGRITVDIWNPSAPGKPMVAKN
jgi:hypothetical protein